MFIQGVIKIIIGRLNKKIQIRSYINKVWTTQFEMWAEFRTPTVSTEEIGGNFASSLIIEINIRYNPKIKKGWYVVYGDHKYEIRHTYEFGKSTTVLVCREVVL